MSTAAEALAATPAQKHQTQVTLSGKVIASTYMTRHIHD